VRTRFKNFHLSEFLQINSGDFRLTSATTAAQQGGSIVLLSSAAARLGLANHEAIAAAKARIEGLALASSTSYASKGLRVNCVAAGHDSPPNSAMIADEISLFRAHRTEQLCSFWPRNDCYSLTVVNIFTGRVASALGPRGETPISGRSARRRFHNAALSAPLKRCPETKPLRNLSV
jgi:NAD(P)-dependent dehydrogenase (short-subunit alcohol dehydrogenase family)